MLGLNALGYEVAHIGLNQWNGVAILSRVGLTDVEVGFPDMPPFGDPPAAEARAIAATCGGVRIWSLYVPNGRALGDPHLTYKLDWLERLRLAASGWLSAREECAAGALPVVRFDVAEAVRPTGPGCLGHG